MESKCNKTLRIYFRVDPALKRKLRNTAKKKKTTLTDIIERALLAYFTDNKGG